MAAPYNYTDKQITEICLSICDNVIHNLTSFNKAIGEANITLGTFYRWLIKSDENKELYNYAREVRADYLFEQIIEIADTTEKGTKIEESETDKGTFTKTIEGDMIEHRRLKIDARKWVVARMNAKKYGDKTSTEITGANGTPLIPVRGFIIEK